MSSQDYTFNIQPSECNCPSASVPAAAAFAPTPASYQQAVYHGQGPLPPNTYVVTTAGPRHKVAMGGCFNNLAAIGSPLRNTAGSFSLCGSRDDRAYPRC